MLSSNDARQFASISILRIVAPALLINISTPSNRSFVHSKISSGAAASVTSEDRISTFEEVILSNSVFVCSNVSWPRATRSKFAPSAANAIAIDFPIPRDAPVMTTLLSLSFKSIVEQSFRFDASFDFLVGLRYAHPMSVEIKIVEQIAIVSFSKATSICGITEAESLFNVLQNIEHNENIHVVILKNVERYGTEWHLATEPEDASIHSKISDLIAGIDLLSRFRQPVIATADGKTIGPGMELFVSADIRLCDSAATFGLQGIMNGFLPLSGAGQRLTRAIGRPSSLRLLLLGELINSDESLRVGLVSSLSDDSFDAALSLAKTISSRGPLAIRAAKEALYRGGEMTLAQGLRYELDLTILLQSTSDRAEGVSAFMQKRQPQFEGK